MRIPASLRRAFLLLAVLAGGMLALGSGALALSHTSAGPLEGDWMLIQAEDEVGPFAVENAGISLLVRGRSASGYAACGGYEVRLSGGEGRLRIERHPGASGSRETEERCPPQLEEVRGLYLAALLSSVRASVEGRTLRLLGEGTHLVFTAIPHFPKAELAGTSWVLESYGDTWSRQRLDARVGATSLRFLGDDRFVATLACGRIIGFFTVALTQATATTYRAPGSASGPPFCPRAAAFQDLRIAEVLQGFRASVRGDRLTLTRNRLEIVFRAATGPPATDAAASPSTDR